MKAIDLQPGNVIRYKYRGEWEYAVWHEDESYTVIGTEQKPPEAGTRIVEGVWKQTTFEPRREFVL